MPHPSYEIRKYTPAFRDQIIELQKGLWSGDAALNSAHLCWKYERNPFFDGPLIYMALYEGAVVGMRGVYGARWLLGEPGRDVGALSSGDLVVAPEHQARNLPRRIMRMAEDDVRALGYRYLLNFSASPVTYLHSIRMGWRDLGAFGTMARWSPLGEATQAVRRFVASRGSLSAVSQRLQRRADSLAFLSAKTAEHRFARLDAGPARQGPIVAAQEARPSAMAEFVERVGRGGRMRHVRDEAYFAWRFRNPLSIYRFLFWGDGRLEGYLVLETSRRAYQTQVRIIDWEASAGEPRAELLRAAIHRGRFADLRVWSATLPTESTALLATNGFTRAKALTPDPRHRHALLAKDLRGDDPLPDLGGWDLRMAFSDKC
jgi:GNAT superfamily N-acetyltransferase